MTEDKERYNALAMMTISHEPRAFNTSVTMVKRFSFTHKTNPGIPQVEQF